MAEIPQTRSRPGRSPVAAAIAWLPLSGSGQHRAWPVTAQRLMWVSVGLALAVAPHVPHLALWIVALTAASALARLAIELNGWQLPPKWLRILFACGALAGVLLDYNTINGVEAGTALLIVMAGMKLLETRSVRDLTVIVFLSYFALFSAFLYNQSLLHLPYMLIAAWLLTITLMRIHETTSAMSMREAIGLTGRMFVQALPLAVLLFLFFPRLAGNFWALPAREQAMTGLSEEMSPGDVSDLSISGAVAFRAQFEGPVPPPRERYWRGPVLHDFDGRTWRRARMPFVEQPITTGGATYRYRLTIEPHQRHWIFPLDVVTDWSGARRAYRTPDLQLLTPPSRPITTLTAFNLESRTTYTFGGSLPLTTRRADSFVPATRNPRTLALARELRARSASDQAFIDAVLAKFRAEEFVYTLEPPTLGFHPVDEFLFETRRGFCEHYASAFTLLARAAGIPARVVTGYQGGEYNDIGEYLVIRQSDAHAWSEVWLEGRGWVRVDPTAAVAPERVERGIDAAMSDGEPVPGRTLRQSALLSRLRLAWDAANSFWNNQIVQFGESQQRWLLQSSGVDDFSWQKLGLGLVVGMTAFFCVLAAYLAWRFRPRLRDPVAQVYHQLCRKLARRDLARHRYEGPSDYLDRVSAARPDLAGALDEIRSLYVSLRYAPAPLRSQLSRLKFLVNQLKA